MTGLAHRELRRRRREPAVARIRHERAIADRPQAGRVAHRQVGIDDDAAALDRNRHPLDERVGPRADRADRRRRVQHFAAGERHGPRADAGGARAGAHVDAAGRERAVRRDARAAPTARAGAAADPAAASP